jgi:hypothetical protein
MRLIILLSYVFFTTFIFSQAEVSIMYEELPDDSIPVSLRFHSCVKPFIGIISKDSTLTNFYIKYGEKTKWFPKGFISPVLDLTYQLTDEVATRSGLGVTFQSENSKKWFYRLTAIQGIGNSSANVRPLSFVLNSVKKDAYVYTDIRGRVSYSPNHIFNFQVGLDNNFVGEGNRSMLLGDFGKPYPFAQIRTNFWRLDYSVMYQFLRENDQTSNWKSKYATSHLLSFNAFKWLNFGVFENVVFAPQDKYLNRGFDVEYLNPVIFYRPQEYALGSSDNSLIGVQLSVKYKKHTLYGQFVLDDFVLAEFRAQTNWWANKYAGQTGVKGRFKYDGQHYFYRIETNFARPYTYSHSSSSQNYANQGGVLAHPLGANFTEFLAEFKWQKEKWVIKALLSYYMKGEDKVDGLNYGGDIYRSYNDRPFEYGVITGQGIKVNITHLMVGAEYLFSNATNLKFFFENHVRANTLNNTSNYQFFIGLRSCLWNDYRNY